MWWVFSCYWFTTTILDVWYFLGPYIICLFVEIFKTCVGAISSVGTFSWSQVNVSNMLTCTHAVTVKPFDLHLDALKRDEFCCVGK